MPRHERDRKRHGGTPTSLKVRRSRPLSRYVLVVDHFAISVQGSPAQSLRMSEVNE